MSIKKNFFAPLALGLGATRRAAMLLLVMLLTMAQTAGAATETRTVTFYMDGGASGNTSMQDDWTLVSSGKTLHWSNNDPSNNKISWRSNKKIADFRSNVIECNGVIEFPNLEGTVKSVALTNFQFTKSGMQMYVGVNKNNTSTLLHLHGTTNDYDYPSNNDASTVYANSATFEGNVSVSSSDPLKIMFSSNGEENEGVFVFKDGTIVITYDVEVEDTPDPGHTFTFSASGNTLTATCNQTSLYHNCSLGTSRKSTLTLTANDASYDWQKHSASLNLTDFSEETGITDINTTLNYTNNATSESIGTAPSEIGSYTVTATIIINKDNEHPYVLTTDFNIVEGYKVNNKYSQFSLSKSSALEGEAMTITYTQQMDESLDGLTLTGATSGNNIAYTQSGNTYTFNMPAEDVNLSATFTYPLNENNITQSGDTYTIKTAEGWNYFCQRMEVDADLNGFSGKTVMLDDNITVTTMAGSTTRPFKGMFDGDGHTLTFNYTADRSNCAPFHITNGATIRNLHATGQIDGGIWHYMGGLVGSASGNLTIENCRVSTQISSTVSGIANNGGFVGLLSSHYNQCHITGCVFDGLIYNPNTWNQTYGCGGFVGGFSQYGYAILKDCLFLHGQYDNGGGKCELWWGNENDKNSTFLHRSNDYGEGTLTNCYYVDTHGRKQGAPAVESATAPTNFAHFGDPTTDYGFLKVYGHTMVFGGKYYTPTYGDLVETYDFSGVKSYNIEYDDKPLGIPDITTQLWVPLLRYKRTFTNGKPVTVMMPFNFTKSTFKKSGSSDGLTGHFYEFKSVNGSAPIMESANEVTEMKANTPYLYVPDDEPEYWYIYNGGDGVNIFTEGNGGGSKVTSCNGWELRGTYTEKVWEEGDPEIGKAYLIGDNGELEAVTAGTKVKPTSAYLVKTVISNLTLTLPDHFEIVNVNNQAYSGNGQDICWDDVVIIKVENGYEATGVTATFTVADNGDGTYTLVMPATDATVTATVKKLLANTDITVTIPSETYTGSALTPTVTVKDGETPLTIDEDYTVTLPAGRSDAGDYTITVTGAGGYSGSRTATFAITKATAVVTSPTANTLTCTGEAQALVTAGSTTFGTLLYSTDGVNYAADIPTGTDVKAYTVYYKVEGSDNWNGVEAQTVDVNIVRKMDGLFMDGCSWTGYVAQEDLSLPDGLTAYAVTALGETTATVTAIGYIPQGVPVLLSRSENTVNLYHALAGSGTAPATNLLQAASSTNQPTAFQDYVLYRDAFYLVSGGTLADGKVFLPIPQGNGARQLSIVEDGHATSVMDNGQWIMDNDGGAWYAVDGRKLSGKPVRKGVYIHEGRKTVIR